MICPYCNGKVELLPNSKEIYHGRDYGPIWICRQCNAYVGCHKGTQKPLGRLADAELRRWKRKAHAAFDPAWRGMGMSRKEAYALMSDRLDISPDKCHIGMFDVDQCKKVVEVFGREIIK